MKCPSCANDQKYREGMRCTQCDYAFVFNPKHGAMMGDAGVLNLVRIASGNHTEAFTEAQLRTVYVAKKASTVPVWIGATFFLGLAAFLAFGPKAYIPAGMVGTIGAGFLIYAIRWRVPWKSDATDALVEGYRTLRGKHQLPKPARLVDDQTLLCAAPPETRAADAFDYGVERLLIVDEPRVVDLLVANNVHADLRCAIVDQRGYPAHLQEPVRDLLVKRPDLSVFLLHGTAGMATPEWVPQDQPMIDIGLSADDFRLLKPFRRGMHEDRGPVPVDALPNRTLHGILERCFATHQPMRDIVKASGSDGGPDFGTAIVGDFG